MPKILLILILGFLCCVTSPVYTSEDTEPEKEKACDAESEEACSTEEDEEELDRGFDPCLIKASLPACKSDTKDDDSDAAKNTPPDTEDPDDSA